MTNTSKISCVIIAKNAESTLKATLDSLKIFDEVILYSNNSTDNTDEIARAYENVMLIEGTFIGFGPTKNVAAGYATNDWVLSLDADEVLSDEFIHALNKLTLNNDNIYSITRENYYKKTLVTHCWGDDVIVRLYNKHLTAFTDKQVHEYIISDNFTLHNIAGKIRHYPYATITDFIIKLDRYSTIYAQENRGKKPSSPLKAFFNAQFSFCKTYIFKGGFLDGYAGLIIAFSHMATNFYKYMKLYEMNKELKSKS